MKNKTSVMRICLCAALAAMGMTAVVHAKTTAWIGSGGDALWSTAGNWNNGLPAAGDAVIVSNLTASAITVENDLGDIAFASLSLQGSAAVTLRGNAITLTGNVAVGAAGSSIYNDITSTGGNGTFINCTATCDFYGTLTHTTGNSSLYANKSGSPTVTFHGPLNMGGKAITMYPRDSHSIVFNDIVTAASMSGSYSTTYAGAIQFYKSGNQINTVTANHSSYQLRTADAFSESTVWGFTAHEKNGHFRLNGFDQTINRLTGGGPGTSDGANCVYSSSAAKLTLKATEDATTRAKIADAITIVYYPEDGACTQTFANRASTTTGDLVVSNGTIALSGTATFKNVPCIVIADGATFDVGDTTSALTGLATLELGDGATFKAASATTPFSNAKLSISVASSSMIEIADGLDFSCVDFRVNGRYVKGGGYYTGADNPSPGDDTPLPQLSGNGRIYIPLHVSDESASTWTAGGGLDERMSTSANWTDGELPDLGGGGLLATFGSAGTNAVVDGAYLLRGIAFNATEASFALSTAVSPATASLSIGADGVIAVEPPDGETRSYSLNVPIVMAAPQYWTVPAGTTLAVHKPISDAAASTAIFKGGTGTLDLCATNSFTGDFTISNGAVRVYSATNAFGAAGGTVYLRQSGGASLAVKADTVIDKNFYFQNAKDQSGWTGMAAGTTCEFSRQFRCNTNWRPYFEGTVIFSGGATISTYFIPGSGKMVFRNVPCSFSTGFNLQGGQIDFEVGGNTFDGGFDVNGGNTVNLYAENVFGASTPVHLGNNNNNTCSMVIHNGTDQRMGTLTLERASATLSARAPMTLTVNQAASKTWAGNISGGVTLVKKGAASVTINRTMSSTGDVAVAEGMLVFGESGRWQGAKSVAASNATISVASPLTFAEDVVLHTSGTGAVSIAENVTVKAAEWFHEGVRQHYAVYTAANSGGHVTGGGTLVVGKGGTLVIFR